MTQAVHRSLKVLEVLVANAPDTPLGEISKQAELSPATTYRILQTLVDNGYAVALDGGRYRPGSKILAVAGQMMISMDYSVAARSALLRLQEFTPETVHFGVLAGDRAQYVDKLEGARPYRLASVIGMTLKLHCTSIGKAILAYLPEARVQRLMESAPLAPHTPRTITEPGRLQKDLAWIREHGYAIDDEEDREGVRCLAAPVFDQVGHVMGAVSISAPAVHLPFPYAMALSSRVIEAANEVSLALGTPLSAIPSVPEETS